MFAAEGQPAVLFKRTDSKWDWRRTGKLVIPVENPGGEPVTLLLRISDEAEPVAERQSLDRARQRRRSHAVDRRALPAPDGNDRRSVSDGCRARAAHIAGNRDRRIGRCLAGHIGPPRDRTADDATRDLVIGPLRVMPPTEAESKAYEGIVDGFGQFRPGSWPEKVGSTEMLRARGAEEAQQLARGLAQAPELDRFGGLISGPVFRATGFFRTERREGRWWLVTPEGHGFFSIGIDAAAPSGATYVEGREFMFRDLPSRDGELAAHWSEADDRRGLGAQRGRSFDHGHAFDFYTANLERKFGADWRRLWREETADRLTAWGFNTIGNWSDPDLWAMHRLPYTVPLSPEGEYAKVSSGEDWWGPMPDPFDPRFAEAADKMARNAAARFARRSLPDRLFCR